MATQERKYFRAILTKSFVKFQRNPLLSGEREGGSLTWRQLHSRAAPGVGMGEAAAPPAIDSRNWNPTGTTHSRHNYCSAAFRFRDDYCCPLIFSKIFRRVFNWFVSRSFFTIFTNSPTGLFTDFLINSHRIFHQFLFTIYWLLTTFLTAFLTTFLINFPPIFVTNFFNDFCTWECNDYTERLP